MSKCTALMESRVKILYINRTRLFFSARRDNFANRCYELIKRIGLGTQRQTV
jgi:hypothetical protein